MNAETVNGWSPPLVWDMGTGERRVATQDDIDKLEVIATAYGKLRQALMKAQEADAEMCERTGAMMPSWVPRERHSYPGR